MELCAVIGHTSLMALYRLVCAFGSQSLVGVLTRCGLPLPVYCLAAEKHSRCLSGKVYLPTIVTGRVLWHLGYTTEASAAAFTESYQAFQHTALQQEPSYRVQGVLTDGFDSTPKSLRTLFPGVRLGTCATRSSNSRRNWRLSHPPCAKPYARSSTPCCTGRDSGRAYGCLRSVSSYATLPIMSPAWQGQPMVNGCGSGCRIRRRAGLWSLKTPGCR